jgi:glucoamylase
LSVPDLVEETPMTARIFPTVPKRARRRMGGVTAAVLVAGTLAAPANAASAAARPGPAPGAPGTLSYFDLARKDCVGTARNTTSKVWFTVARGVLSDVYEPTVDNTNVHDMNFVITDGSTFTDLQTRDLTYVVRADPTGSSPPTSPTRVATRCFCTRACVTWPRPPIRARCASTSGSTPT